MSKANLRFSTDILRRLGEELNPNIDQGILELVKNSYDADARHCKVEFIDIEPFFDREQTHGKIEVTDDGIGMDLQAIKEGWLVLGRSSKSYQELTPKYGRLRAGSKGLGRLAALRTGAKASMITRPEDDQLHEYEIVIDWEKFEKVEVVEEVELEIEKRKRQQGSKSGTVISISEFGAKVNRINTKQLARGILLLADPFGDDPKGFQPELVAPEYRDLELLVERRYFDDAEFHLVAEVDDGKARAQVTDWKGKELYSIEHIELSRKEKGRLYDCPAAKFDLWVFILSRDKFISRSTTMDEIRKWLGQFGGVHLYSRGLRIAPYGDPGNDWLDMNLSRARSPEFRPSTNTAIGRMALNDPKESLLQKTDRSGLIENEAFYELKRFATDALDRMARRRLDEGEKRRTAIRVAAPKKSKTTKETVEEAINKLPKRERKELETTFSKYDRARAREVRNLEKEVQLYRTMSTAGITAAVFAHETRHPLELIVKNTKLIYRRGQELLSQRKFGKTLDKPIDRIIRQTKALQAFVDLTLSLVDHEKRRASRIEVHKSITNILEIFGLLLKERDVNVITELDCGNPYLRGSEAAIESIITNLLANSLKAFEEARPRNRKIVIQTEITEGWILIRALDNGPGIQDISIRDIWLPGETTYPNGTGLGLTIVRDTVNDLGGRVDAVKQGELDGAEIKIWLPIIGA